MLLGEKDFIGCQDGLRSEVAIGRYDLFFLSDVQLGLLIFGLFLSSILLVQLSNAHHIVVHGGPGGEKVQRQIDDLELSIFGDCA